MKNKLFLVSLLSTALSAMTAGAISDITDFIQAKYGFAKDGVISSSEYSSITGASNNGDATAVKLLKTEGPAGPTVTDLTSYIPSTFSSSGDHYALAKWGQGSSGLGSVYKVYDLWSTDTDKVPTTLYYPTSPTTSVTSGGLSYFKTVPDGGSTVMLLGAALSAIAVARCKFGV